MTLDFELEHGTSLGTGILMDMKYAEAYTMLQVLLCYFFITIFLLLWIPATFYEEIECTCTHVHNACILGTISEESSVTQPFSLCMNNRDRLIVLCYGGFFDD